MEYAQEKAPELVAPFFKTQEVTPSETYYPLLSRTKLKYFRPRLLKQEANSPKAQEPPTQERE